MTYYQQQIIRISKAVYPEEYLCDQVMRAKQYIDNHYSENIGLNDMAKEAFFSKFHFIRLFKKMYGLLPSQYLSSVRIKNAKELLENGVPVSKACNEVGFASLSSFNRLFKKSYGITPSAFYRKAIQDKHSN